jgi:molybdenum cofactor synthesis domain-containing protein
MVADQTGCYHASVPSPTAGVLLIGNELLSGKVRDENAYFLARELAAIGVRLQRVVVVPDERDEIIDALRDLLRRVDLVFTAGGIGPTHDDITMDAVARALDRDLVLDPGLEARAREIFGARLGPAHLKMAWVPRGCDLVQSDELRWPTVAVDRVYVLAGIPKILRRGFRAVQARISGGRPAQLASVYVTTDEWTLAPLLDATVTAHPQVQVGSYPDMESTEHKVRVTFEAADPAAVHAAVEGLLARIPPGEVVRVER